MTSRPPLSWPRNGVVIDHESDHWIKQTLDFGSPDGHLVELACYELRGKPEEMSAAA